MRWHLYCRVVDNFGDIGVAWRLAADLASRGEAVRLAVDDASALAWMAPDGAERVEVRGWNDAVLEAPDVVVELFGGGIPEDVAVAAAHASPAPVVVNVEHLSAEGYVDRSHGLPSPRRATSGESFTTWYFYAGFTARTGGLPREPGLIECADAFDVKAWLATIGVRTRPGERRVALFCYPDSAVVSLVEALQDAPTLLLLAHGAATAQARDVLGDSLARGVVRAIALPPLSQPDFDRLLWSCDLNLVRGEDSLVRAIWAGAPFVWQLYVQADGAHRIKLAAFLERFLAGAPASLDEAVRPLFDAWNDSASGVVSPATLDPTLFEAWRGHCRQWRATLAGRDDLITQLIRFVESKR